MVSDVKKTKHAGGRPKKAVKRDQQLALMCNQVERNVIEFKAKAVNASVSEFLRSLALKGHIDRSVKSLPKEILLFTGTLNHLAANINQVAKKRNPGRRSECIRRRSTSALSFCILKLAFFIIKINLDDSSSRQNLVRTPCSASGRAPAR